LPVSRKRPNVIRVELREPEAAVRSADDLRGAAGQTGNDLFVKDAGCSTSEERKEKESRRQRN